MQNFSVFVITILICAGCSPPVSHATNIKTPTMLRHVPQGNHQESVRPASPVLLRKKNGHYRVMKPWTIEMDGHRWNIQKGYSTNGITAPTLVKAELGDSVSAPETWAAVYHDWLFTQPGISRSEADKLFYQLLIAYGVSPIKARVMYTVVSAYSASKSVH